MSILFSPLVLMSIFVAQPIATRATSQYAACVEGASVTALSVLPRDEHGRTSLVLSNRSQDAITRLVIGGGVSPALLIDPATVPTKLDAPHGWSANRVYEEEGEHMFLVWIATDRNAAIAPGASSDEFAIYSPAGFSVIGVPYHVWIGNGQCLSGRINAETR
jgi:hypothetical protein